MIEQPAGAPAMGPRRLSTKDADEDLARRFLESVLHEPVIVHDMRSGHSTYDLEIRYADGRLGAAEVVSSREPAQEALLSEVTRIGYTHDARLTRMWTIRVMPDAQLRKLHRLVPSFLAQLELLGVDILDRNRYYGAEIHRALQTLRIRSCMSCPPTARHPPGFYLLPDAWASWVGDGEDIRRYGETFLADAAQADVLRKLTQSGADEHHAVIVITTGQLGAHTAVDMRLLPSSPPQVHDCVDWLWIIASQAPPAQGCYWSRESGWATAALLR